MANTVFNFTVEDSRARAAFSRLQREVHALDREFTTTHRDARETSAAIDALGQEAEQSATQARALHTEMTALTTAIDGRTGQSVEGVTRQLREQRAALAAVHAQLGTHVRALQAFTAANTSTATAAQDASQETAQFARTLAHLRATADDTRGALTDSRDVQQLVATFRTATDASTAYYTERIRQAAAARAAETAGAEAFNPAHVDIFQLGRQRLAAHRQLATEQQERNVVSRRQAIANSAYRTQVAAPLPEPDERIAAAARDEQTLIDMRHAAAEQGRHRLRQVHQSEARDTQISLDARAKQYQQFTNLVANTFVGLAAGKTRSFESIATAFIRQSIRLISRAVIENQLLKRLDDGLTAAKLANLRKVAAAQQAGGIGNVLGQVPGLGTIGNLGGALSGGGLALGAASLLFPEQLRNLTGGIADTLKGVLENVSHQPVVVKANIQNNLRIGDNEAREISDIQAELRTEDRL